MSDHEYLRLHRLNVSGRVEESLSLHEARTRRIEAQRIRGESLGCNFETGSRSGRGFNEEVDYSRPSQGGYFFNLTLIDCLEALRVVENVSYLASSQMAKTKEMFKRRVLIRHGSFLSALGFEMSQDFIPCVYFGE